MQIKSWLTPTLLVVIVCLLYVLGVLIIANGDPKAFILIGTRFSEGDPQGTEGYDGQFAYQIAMNPSGAAPYVDVPCSFVRACFTISFQLCGTGVVLHQCD